MFLLKDPGMWHHFDLSFIVKRGRHTSFLKNFVFSSSTSLARAVLQVLCNVVIMILIILILEQPCLSLSKEPGKIALFPLKNMSGNDEVPLKEIMDHIANGLHRRHGFEIVSPSDLEGFFLKNRIRRFGSVTKAQAKELKREFGADIVAITWVDLYEKGDNPRIGIGIRFVDTGTSAVIWSNYVSLTGEDFTSWLGLGKITSIEQLQSKAIDRLMDSLPPSFREVPAENENTLFALERFSLMPLISKGGGPVRVSLHLVSLAASPEKLFLLVGGREWPLENAQKGWWKGEIRAPKKEGNYFVRLKLITKAGKALFFYTASYLKVDNTPPNVRLSYENPIFSPNGDGNKDTLIVFPELLHPEDINLWGIYIYNEKGELVKRFEGGGDLPLAIAWHGETDSFAKAEEGTYYLECRSQDKAGNIAITPRGKIVLDMTPPKLNVMIDVKNNKAQFSIKCKDLTRISQWELKILDKKESVCYDLKKDGTIPTLIKVPLSGRGHYFVIEASDMAGNRTECRGSLVSQKMITGKKTEKREKAPSAWDYKF